MEQNTYSYEEYLKVMSMLPDVHLHERAREIIRHFQNGQCLPSRYAPVVYLLDYTTNRYVYVDEACFDLYGYTAREIIEEGIAVYLSKWHPDDYRVMNSKVFPENIRFLQTVALERYPNLIFSINYRVLNAKGEYITIVQRSSYIPGTVPGKPLGSIGVVFDISHFKNDVSIVHTIEEAKYINGSIYNELLYKKVYAVQGDDGLSISKRELEVLKWMAAGLSSKQIALKLGLSINTVNNHRKNMLHKTGCKSSTELLNHAFKQGYL